MQTIRQAALTLMLKQLKIKTRIVDLMKEPVGLCFWVTEIPRMMTCEICVSNFSTLWEVSRSKMMILATTAIISGCHEVINLPRALHLPLVLLPCDQIQRLKGTMAIHPMVSHSRQCFNETTTSLRQLLSYNNCENSVKRNTVMARKDQVL